MQLNILNKLYIFKSIKKYGDCKTMAMLLAMFQKMKLTREINNLVLKQSLNSSKLTRIEKNITNIQKRYEGKIKQVSQQAQRLINQAKQEAYMGFGLTNSVFAGMAGVAGGLASNAISSFFANDKDLAAKYELIKSNGGSIYKIDGKGGQTPLEYNGVALTQDDLVAFNKAQTYATQSQAQAQAYAQQYAAYQEQQISIWQQNMEQMYEEEQLAALEPLEMEQTMMELDKAYFEQQLDKKRAEKEQYDQLCSQEAKESAPKFGLG